MNKPELIKEISSRIEGSTQKEVSAFLEAYIVTVEEAVARGEKVQLVGFGTFERAIRNGREGVSKLQNAEGKAWKTEDGFKPVFHAGKEFKEKVDVK